MRDRIFLLIVPTLALLLAFFFLPLIILAAVSFQKYIPGSYLSEFTTENYKQMMDPAYLNYMIVTLRVSLVSTITSVLLVFPAAYLVAQSERKTLKKVLLGLVIVAFFVSSIARVFSWMLVLGEDGIVNIFLGFIGIGHLKLLNTEFAVDVGTIHFLAPFAFLTIIGPLKNVRPSVREAAQSLGANGIQTFITVTLPLCLHGVVSAMLLCYALGLTMFITPLMLGGGLVDMMSNIIYFRLTLTLNWPFAAAMSVVLLAVALAFAYGMNRILLSRIPKF